MTTFRDDRGAILVHVAFALLALMAFTSFSLDYGVMWESRRQAQNAADAGALAAAHSLAESADDATIQSVGSQIAHVNFVFGQTPAVTIKTPSTPFACPDDGSFNCVQVNVFRDTAHGNALPMFFGAYSGVTSQSVQATATAKIVAGNATNCMMPWAVPDLFTDANHDGVYDAGDTYTAPTSTDPGTGYSVANDYGTQVVLKGGPHSQLSPGWFQATDIGGNGAAGYRSAIEGCVDTVYGIGDVLPPENGNMQGPTQQGLNVLIAKDPDAVWNASTKTIDSSCVSNGSCSGYSVSPRVVPVPVFDTADFAATGDIKIVNIFGFFAEDPDTVTNPPAGFDPKFDMIGVLINVPAIDVAGDGTVGTSSSFSKIVGLIR